jgi:hypothetical protein
MWLPREPGERISRGVANILVAIQMAPPGMPLAVSAQPHPQAGRQAFRPKNPTGVDAGQMMRTHNTGRVAQGRADGRTSDCDAGGLLVASILAARLGPLPTDIGPLPPSVAIHAVVAHSEPSGEFRTLRRRLSPELRARSLVDD